jgi:sugar lactone lactonase YvrE
MVDSLGRQVAENDFGGGDSGAAGADGSAGDGAPIANAPVILTDNAGHTATATTDAQGYYRVNVKGFTPPFVAKVTRADGTVWYSPSTTPVKTRGFVTMNITGLTDKVGGYVAEANSVTGGAEKVTPLILAANPSSLQSSKTRLNTALTSPLTYVGLSPTTFDPVASPYQAVKSDNYDRLLERLIMSKDPTKGNTVVVGTFAGVKESFVNGTGATASFSSVRGVAVDGSGNVFVADTGNHAIRKITPAGVVSTFAGSGSSGFTNGTGTTASFSWPNGVAVDSSGNVFVADTGNHAIRKITLAGVVSTLAGSGSEGFSNGTGTTASFFQPRGVAVDSSGNVFVADEGNSAIRKITPAGVVSTFAGGVSNGFINGVCTTASFCWPRGVAVDNSGNVFVADAGNAVNFKITPAGVVSTLAGGGTAAGLTGPSGVAVDNSGNVFVADTDQGAILKITPAGVVSTFAGGVFYGFTNGIGAAASFCFPSGVAVDNSGNVFVADSCNNAIRKITPTGVVSTFAGSGSSGFSDGTGTAARFYGPTGVAVDGSGNVFVADSNNYAIRKISPAGVVSTLAGDGPDGFFHGAETLPSAKLPDGVAVDGSGNVFVADSGNSTIRKISSAGMVSTLAGSGSLGFSNGTGTAASFARPSGVAVDSSGNVFVADTYNHAIRKITPAGVVSTFAGGVSYGFTNGTGTVASFSMPTGVAVDSSGNVFVADTGNNVIRKITPAGVVSTFAGSGTGGFTNGTGTAASFLWPTGVAVDNSGNVFVADKFNYAIRKISPSGVVSTLSGNGTGGYRNNTGTGAVYSFPTGVALDKSANVFVADSDNHAIRIILP